MGIAMGWEHSQAVATDSQAAIGRINSLKFEEPKGWIEQKLVRAARGG